MYIQTFERVFLKGTVSSKVIDERLWAEGFCCHWPMFKYHHFVLDI